MKIVADVTKDAERIINETIKHFGRLDVLVNNAGIVALDCILDFKLDQFERIFDINLKSILILTHLAIPHLEKTKGNIINVSSIAGSIPVSDAMTYCISKAALNQFTKCSALDLTSKGIRVNAINPNVIKMPIFQTIGMEPSAVEQRFESFKAKYSIGKVGHVNDTSHAIAFLASEETSFLTGILLPVDSSTIVAGSS